VVVTMLIAATTFVVITRKKIGSLDVTICYWASIITLLQIVLGILTVRSSLSVLMAMFHTGGALLLFTLLLWLNFRTQTIVGTPEAAWFVQIVRDYLSLTKPRINALVLVTTFIGAWLAFEGAFDPGLLVSILLGTGLTVAGAAAFNCYQEAEIDAKMSRTRNRPVPAGRISTRNAFLTGLICSLLGLLILLTLVNTLSCVLAFTALVVYTPIYTWLKKLTSLSTLVGAIPGALPPAIGWAGVRGEINLPAILLFLIMFVWQPPHFLALALYKKNEYDEAGLAMLPIEMSDDLATRQMITYSAALLPLSLLPVHFGMAGFRYFLIATVLGLGFLGSVILGLFDNFRGSESWSRGVFLFSILHLTALFSGFFLD
jgi:protoheme IX farnesyltransferase